MQRVLFLKKDKLLVFHWLRNTLAGKVTFYYNEESFSSFELYLASLPKTPIKILVDVIEEDFKHEEMPRVIGSAKTALIERYKRRLFRDSNHTYVEAQGKSPTSPKKNIFLFSGITNPDLLKPWIDRLIKWEIPIQGIWSLPVLSREILKYIKTEEPHILLISQETVNSVRETYFVNGKLKFSRLAPVKLDRTFNCGKVISEEVERATTFLLNHRLLGYTDLLEVHIICHESFYESVSSHITFTDKIIYHIHQLDTLNKKIGLKKAHSLYLDICFSWICSKQSSKSDQYSNKFDRRFYYQKIASYCLTASSVILFIVGLIVAQTFISQGLQLHKQIADIQSNTANLQASYDHKFLPLEEQLADAYFIKNAIHLTERLQHEKDLSPLDLILVISRLLSKSEFSDINIQQIRWLRTTSDKVAQLNQGNFSDYQDIGVEEQSMDDNYEEIYDDQGNPIKPKKIQAAIINGWVSLDSDKFRKIYNQIQNFIAHLENHPRTHSLEIFEVPVDTRSQSNLDGTNRAFNTNGEEIIQKAKFSFKLTFMQKENVKTNQLAEY